MNAGTERIKCPSCGVNNFPQQAVCWKCGCILKPKLVPTIQMQPVSPLPRVPTPAVLDMGTGQKDKSIAIILAVLFGFWTWFYTLKTDAELFWLAFGITIFNIVMGVCTLGLWWIICFPIELGIRIWALMDVIIRPTEFYYYYPQYKKYWKY